MKTLSLIILVLIYISVSNFILIKNISQDVANGELQNEYIYGNKFLGIFYYPDEDYWSLNK